VIPPSNLLVLQTVVDSVLLSKQNVLPRVLRSSTNRSLFPNDKDSNETVTFITTQTLRNTAANRKRQCRKKGGKVWAIRCHFKLLSRLLRWTLFNYTCLVYAWFQLCDQLYILLMHVIFTFSGRSTLRESWQAEMNQILCNEKHDMLIHAKRHVFFVYDCLFVA
jgi:hypothetical protein